MSQIRRKYYAVPKAAENPDGGILITTSGVDHDGDRVMPEGADLSVYLNNPIVLWLHDAYGRTASAGIPVGTTKSLEVVPGKGIRATGIDWLEGDPFVDRVRNAWTQGKIRAASIGFQPIDAKPNEFGGYDILSWTMLEWSLVPIPANPNAVRAAGGLLSALKALGVELDPELLEPEGESALVTKIAGAHRPPEVIDELADEPVGWMRRTARTFDITRERFEPDLAEYALAARYLAVEVKNLYRTDDFIPSPRMGSFLAALHEGLGEWVVEDVRNLTARGTECPPIHEVVELNSRLRADFLVHGIRFMRSLSESTRRLVFKVEPDWGGLSVTVYAAEERAGEALDFLDATWARAKTLNYLRGEAFSLSGQFLTRGGESWGDVFLDEKNQQPLQRVVKLLNEHGAAATNRGLLLVGPPGTGKTLSGRVIMNEARATFIWVSARDFYRAGAFGGLAYGFSLARECAPSVLFIEDVDNWLGPHTIDLLKTEMDGIGQSAGVVTILTTNYPERLPDSLIDRPGRFHDVLQLTLPGAAERARMLAAWLPDLNEAALTAAVEATDGYSGAHLRELARFVRVIAEEEALAPPEALSRALVKLQEQRELITNLQTTDSRYRPAKGLSAGLGKLAWAKSLRVRNVRQIGDLVRGALGDLTQESVTGAAIAAVLEEIRAGGGR